MDFQTNLLTQTWQLLCKCILFWIVFLFWWQITDNEGGSNFGILMQTICAGLMRICCNMHVEMNLLIILAKLMQTICAELMMM